MPPHVARGGTVVKPRWYSHGLNRLAYYFEAIVTALEGAVRAHPTQWFNFFDVWAPPVGYP